LWIMHDNVENNGLLVHIEHWFGVKIFII